MAIFGTLLEPSDILEAGDLRICTAGRYQKVPEEDLGKAVAEPQIVQVSGGIVTQGHDAFFREGPIDKFQPYVEVKKKVTELTSLMEAVTKELASKDEKIADLKDQNSLLSDLLRSLKPTLGTQSPQVDAAPSALIEAP